MTFDPLIPAAYFKAARAAKACSVPPNGIRFSDLTWEQLVWIDSHIDLTREDQERLNQAASKEVPQFVGDASPWHFSGDGSGCGYGYGSGYGDGYGDGYGYGYGSGYGYSYGNNKAI